MCQSACNARRWGGRASLAWDEIARGKKRLDLKESESALAEAKLAEARETVKTRLKECWCYLIYPHQESAQTEIGWSSSKVPAQDGLLSRASKKLVGDEGLLPELGPARLDRDLQKYIWADKPHLSLKDLAEYLSRYTYLPRLKNQGVLVKAVQAAVSGMFPGPFAYAERWDEANRKYLGLLIERTPNAHIVIDSDSVIIKPDVAAAQRPAESGEAGTGAGASEGGADAKDTGGDGNSSTGTMNDGGKVELLPTRFVGTVMISPDRPARDMHQIVDQGRCL